MTGTFRVTSLTESEVRDEAFRGFPKICIDDQGLIVFANPTAERMFGYISGELQGKSLDILIPPEYRDKHNEGRQKFFANPPRKSRMEVVGLTKTGEHVDAVVGIVPFVKHEQQFAIAVLLAPPDPA